MIVKFTWPRKRKNRTLTCIINEPTKQSTNYYKKLGVTDPEKYEKHQINDAARKRKEYRPIGTMSAYSCCNQFYVVCWSCYIWLIVFNKLL